MCMRRKFAGNCPTKSQGRFAALLMASEDVSARMARKRSLNESMLGSLVGQSKTLTVLEFSRDKLAPLFVGETVDGATGGCDGMLILSPTQQGYSQDTVTFIRVRKTARRPFPDPLPHHVPSHRRSCLVLWCR